MQKYYILAVCLWATTATPAAERLVSDQAAIMLRDHVTGLSERLASPANPDDKLFIASQLVRCCQAYGEAFFQAVHHFGSEQLLLLFCLLIPETPTTGPMFAHPTTAQATDIANDGFSLLPLQHAGPRPNHPALAITVPRTPHVGAAPAPLPTVQPQGIRQGGNPLLTLRPAQTAPATGSMFAHQTPNHVAPLLRHATAQATDLANNGPTPLTITIPRAPDVAPAPAPLTTPAEVLRQGGNLMTPPGGEPQGQ